MSVLTYVFKSSAILESICRLPLCWTVLRGVRIPCGVTEKEREKEQQKKWQHHSCMSGRGGRDFLLSVPVFCAGSLNAKTSHPSRTCINVCSHKVCLLCQKFCISNTPSKCLLYARRDPFVLKVLK